MSVVLPQCLYESARAMWLVALIIPVNPVLALISCTFICRLWIGRDVAVCKSSESQLSQLIWSQLASADDGSVDFIVTLTNTHRMLFKHISSSRWSSSFVWFSPCFAVRETWIQVSSKIEIMGKLRKYPETLWTQAPGLWSDYGNLSRDGASLQEELGKKMEGGVVKGRGKGNLVIRRKGQETIGKETKRNERTKGKRQFYSILTSIQPLSTTAPP